MEIPKQESLFDPEKASYPVWATPDGGYAVQGGHVIPGTTTGRYYFIKPPKNSEFKKGDLIPFEWRRELIPANQRAKDDEDDGYGY